MSKYTDEKDAVCGVCESIFGNFHDNFITVDKKGGEEVSQECSSFSQNWYYWLS